MTAGHPDWQSYAAWRGGAFVNLVGTAIPGLGASFGPFALPHYAGVSFYASCSGSTLWCQLIFSTDAAGLNQLQVVSFTINSTSKVTCNVPALAGFVSLVITNAGGIATSATLWLQPSNIPAQVPQYITSTNATPLLWGSASVAASGSLQVASAEVYAGPVALFAGTSSGTSHHGLLNYLDEGTTAFRNIAAWNGPTDGQRVTKLAAAPAAQLQMSGNNDDTVARTLTLAVTRAA